MNASSQVPGEQDFRQTRQGHWDQIHRNSRRTGGSYHRQLASVFRHMIPDGSRILEIGCAKGQLLSALNPSFAVGVDWSPAAVQSARNQFPEYTFIVGDGENLAANLPASSTFDFIILSDLLNDVWDVQKVLTELQPYCLPSTRLIGNFYRPVWGPILGIAQKLGLMQPLLQQNWLTPKDLTNLTKLSGFEVVRIWSEILFPARLPGLNFLLNRVFARIWPTNKLNLAQFFVARRRTGETVSDASVSVVVPARNESGNIEPLLERLPEMGPNMEVIFVEGGSSDDTLEVIRAQLLRPQRFKCHLVSQQGEGKGDAVRAGFAKASGDILMILDADLTVPPETLPRFYDALCSNDGEFVNGVRLVYPMEKEAMQALNRLGNQFFSFLFTHILGQPVRDTLCGTKVLWKEDYVRISRGRSRFGNFDPFGDFDLLYGAAALHLKIVEVPVRYRARSFGATNIRRWVHGWALMKMSWFGFRKLRFGPC